jgi:hypothetical protein
MVIPDVWKRNGGKDRRGREVRCKYWARGIYGLAVALAPAPTGVLIVGISIGIGGAISSGITMSIGLILGRAGTLLDIVQDSAFSIVIMTLFVIYS